LFSYSGVFLLGLGDSSAAIIGKYYGKITWNSYTKKTYLGSFAFIVSTLIAYGCLEKILSGELRIFPVIAVAVVIVAVIEGLTKQFDNLICTIAVYSIQIMIYKEFYRFG
jgi:dolichol kinase